MDVPENTYVHDISAFVTFEQLREQLGIPQSTIDDRLEALGITIYVNPADRRRRMVRTKDVERLLRPQPAKRRRTTRRT